MASAPSSRPFGTDTRSRASHLSLDLATRPRAHAPLPMIQPGSFAASQVGFDEATAGREADRCFRCDAVYGGPVMEVQTGRGPGVVPSPELASHATHENAGGTQ